MQKRSDNKVFTTINSTTMKNIILIILLVTSFLSCGVEPGASCFDLVQNGAETGIDCGGDCDPCISCDDGIQNGDEIGIDCGSACGVACPIVIDCTGEDMCMKAIVEGLKWEALEVEAAYDSSGLSIVGSNFDFIRINDQDGRRRAQIGLFFPDPEDQSLPYTITIDTDSDLVSLAIIIEGLPDIPLRDYDEIISAELVLREFDTNNKTAAGDFSLRGKTISEVAPFSEVQAIAWDGKFNVSW